MGRDPGGALWAVHDGWLEEGAPHGGVVFFLSFLARGGSGARRVAHGRTDVTAALPWHSVPAWASAREPWTPALDGKPRSVSRLPRDPRPGRRRLRGAARTPGMADRHALGRAVGRRIHRQRKES